MSTYTQGAATLYPGLCASALTARAGQCIFCEQVVRVNQEQFHFGYIKLDTLIIYPYGYLAPLPFGEGLGVRLYSPQGNVSS